MMNHHQILDLLRCQSRSLLLKKQKLNEDAKRQLFRVKQRPMSYPFGGSNTKHWIGQLVISTGSSKYISSRN